MMKIISMILVGGKGTRLSGMTKDKAKPAVSFGGKYRLIDFTLSNLSHSHIDVCGIVTQYEPMDLMKYVGNGTSWDLDYSSGGIRFLTPYLKKDDILWQKGTGHAVKQFFDFVEDYASEYVLILSGDHIYKMDYDKMFKAMLSDGSDITIASKRMDTDNLSQYGIIETDEFNHVTHFHEKPKQAPTNNVSMGIYIFKKDILEKLLFGEKELLDFGHDIIPEAIAQGKKILAYEFDGYWRDVGTIESLYDVHMEMLDDPSFLGLNSSKNSPIFSKSLNLQPHLILENGKIENSVIADGCVIDGHLIHSSIAYRVIVKKGSFIKDSCILPNSIINEGVHIEKAIVNEETIIPKNYRSINQECVLITNDNLFDLGDIHE